jgi:hypothetical protein
MKYIIDEITIRDLSMINDDMIIGLRFLQLISTLPAIVATQLQCYFLFSLFFSQDPWWLVKPEYVGRWFKVIRCKILLST